MQCLNTWDYDLWLFVNGCSLYSIASLKLLYEGNIPASHREQMSKDLLNPQFNQNYTKYKGAAHFELALRFGQQQQQQQ